MGRAPSRMRVPNQQRRYLLSPAAQIDLEQIWDYTCHRWDVEQADEYLRELQRAIQLAAVSPRIGRACNEIRPGYRLS
jgi:toxin ParE1/3/4